MMARLHPTFLRTAHSKRLLSVTLLSLTVPNIGAATPNFPISEQTSSKIRKFGSGTVPSTLKGDPIKAVVPPGVCQFNEEFVNVKLLKRWQVSETSCVLRFGLPDNTKPLDLSTCACILAKADIPEQVIRPYTPISTNKQIGTFDLLVKNYKENGQMSRYICETLLEGEELEFKHIDFNVKIQYPFKCKRIGMLVGGSGITPMIQALHAILGDGSSDVQVDMLYGSRFSSDILGQSMLDDWAKKNDRFHLTHVLSQEPTSSDWIGTRGHIDRAMIEEHFPSPDEDCLIFVCGPPGMYEAFCGARDDKNLSGLLADIGYTAEQVVKF